MNFNKQDSKSCDDENKVQLENESIKCVTNMIGDENLESVKIPVKLPQSSYIVQLISAGIRPDNIYEVKMILAPEVDMTSVKITIKDNNLRVTLRKRLDKTFKQLLQNVDKTFLDDLIEKSVKHYENFLIPETINDEKVRAVMDNKERLLILTAPAERFSRTHVILKLYIIMEKLPRHCRENGFFFKQLDHAELVMKSDGIRTGFNFVSVPDFYNLDDREYFATEIKFKGLKVSAATLATENVLNIKMQETEGQRTVRNLNFFIPEEADPRKVSVEVFSRDTIVIKAPLQKLTREKFVVNRPE